MSLRDRIKPFIRELEPYVPGKPIEELERELGIEGSVKLASNENALGPSPRAIEAIRGCAERVHRYPDGTSYALRRALSERLSVAPETLVFGTGSSELLELLAKCLLGPADETVFAWPSFAMYPIVCGGMGATSVRVPLDGDLVHDLPAMARAITDRTKLVVACNPNNPTGTSVGAEAFDRFAADLPDDVVLVIDEAYGEYARRPDFPDALSWVARRPATAVLRTFSKIYGLAGVRIGYGVMDPELASYLERARHPFNVTVPGEAAALAALGDDEHVARSRTLVAQGAAYLEKELGELGIRVWPTDANFVLAEAGEGVYEQLLERGVIVRPMRGFGLSRHVRISIGTPAENERLVEALRGLEGSS